MAINVKKLLSEALIELTDEKPLSKITVSDIVKRAGTGRQTFYNHFRDKNDLVFWIFLQTLKGERKIVQTQGYFAYLLSLYEKAQVNRHFFQQACALEGQNSLMEAILTQTYNHYRDCILHWHGAEMLTDQVLYSLWFNAYGATYSYIMWAKEGMPGSAEAKARYALHCMPPCIKQFLPIRPEDLE
ncbi:MAG TPA: TetR family transcriptional regulator [Oscillospiraceae bacterium]|nr:TetR family transcriptional regulator [Oscillospiraceae bacterium]